MDWLKAIAPAIATAMGSPLAGAAVSFLASKIGVKEETVEAVTDALNTQKMSPDQIASIKMAEMEFRKFLESNKIDLERVLAADRDSARKMQVDTRSRIPGALAVLITLGFFGILVGMMTGSLDVSDKQALLILLGALSTSWGAVVNFYYGSSHGSQNKDVLLANSAPTK